MNASKQPDESTDSVTPAKTATRIGEATLNGLPMLTEVVSVTDAYLPRLLSEAEIQQLLPRLEAQIETLFARKLGSHLEQLQRQAIELAIGELKAELPELLHEALYEYLESHK